MIDVYNKAMHTPLLIINAKITISVYFILLHIRAYFLNSGLLVI